MDKGKTYAERYNVDTDENGVLHSVSGTYWVLVDEDNKPPVIYGGCVPCFHFKRLATEAKRIRGERKWKVKKVVLNYR